MNYFTRLSLAFFLLITALGCDSGSVDPDDAKSGTVFLSINNLNPIPGDYHLEAWIVTAKLETFSLGKFTVGENQTLVDLSGEAIIAGKFDVQFSVDSARVTYVTIEPPGDTDDAPSSTRLMGGLFIDGTATLLTTDVEGIEDGLILAQGSYILETPTNGPNSFEQSGLWFINLTGGPPARGLRITIPIPGWNYQAWTESDGVLLDMGIISNHSQPDNSNLYSGPQPGYNYPGEDFLVNAPSGLVFPLDLPGARVTVSLEPDPDPDPKRSQFILFEGVVPQTTTTGDTYDLVNQTNSWPSGTAVISRK